MKARSLTLNLHDTTLGIWQDDADDPSFGREVFGGLIRHLRSTGWAVRFDPDVVRRHPCLRQAYRLAFKGPLRANLHVCGRHIEMQIWSTDWPSDNRNGHRYCSHILTRMPFLSRLRVALAFRRAEAWLSARFMVASVKRSETWSAPKPTPLQRIAASYAASCHTDKTLGRPVCRDKRNARSADGGTIEHDTRVWFLDDRGRICRGHAFYCLNNAWWVIGGGQLRSLCSTEIYVRQPADLRQRRNDRRRRGKLEGQLAQAIGAMDFARATTLRTILFGDAEVFQIWSTKWATFYGPNFCGYTPDRLKAGRYTWAEAFDEVRRVPHLLRAVAPDGSLISANDMAAAVA